MKRFVPLLVLVALGSAVACTTATSPTPTAGTGSTSSPQPQPAVPPPAVPPATSTTPAVVPEPTRAPSKAAITLTPAEEAEAAEKAKKLTEMVGRLAGASKTEPIPPHVDEIVVDPKTGQKQLRMPKSPSYYVVRGRLYLSIIKDREGVPILREDKDAWYVEPLKERPVSPRLALQEEQPDAFRIVDVPPEEAEVVTPAPSKVRIRFVERSEGLPTVGMWRENFDVGDLDGDGRPEIVTTPPRLSGKDLQIFRWDGKRWASPKVVFDNPENIPFEYGGVALGDFDGDGRLDIVFGRHGGGPAIAFNKGQFRFRIESRGLPQRISTRVMAVGDLDGDGKLDIAVQSDESEFIAVKQAENQGNASARLPQKDGFIAGFDTRTFLNRGDKFVESHKGLEESCYGYTMALFAPAPDGKAPFYASSCRYQGNAEVLYAYDKAADRFVHVGTPITERKAMHLGTAKGIYQGHPAAFMTYQKTGPPGASRNMTGDGISIYYRDGDEWKRKRLLKRVMKTISCQGIAVGDLDGDGLDDVVFADDITHRLRIFLQQRSGEFEELATELEPTYPNHATAVRLADMDGDGRLDVFLMYEYETGDETREGGLKVFQNLR